MSLSNEVAEAVVGLAHHPEFDRVWRYFKEQADLMVQEILSSSTDVATREVLVRFHEVFRREVVELPERSSKQLNRQTAGQAQAPVKE